MRILLLACLTACHSAEGARPESHATLSGVATFPNGAPGVDRGSVSLVVHGVAESLDNSCRSDAREFVATYDGELVVGGDGSFTVPLYPRDIVTTDGCVVTSLRIEHVTSIALQAQLGDRPGRGDLRFQNLAAIDADELRSGSFDELVGDLVF